MLKFRNNPLIDRGEFDIRCCQIVFLAIDMHATKTRSIPKLVAEVPVAFDPFHVEANRAGARGDGIESKPQRVGAIGHDAVGVLLARRLPDALCHSRLHHVGGALGHQVVQ